MLRCLSFCLAPLLLVGCAHRTGLEDHLAAAERKANDAESLIIDAEKQLDALRPAKAKEELARARAELADPAVSDDPDALIIKGRLAEAERRLPGVRQQGDKHDVELAAAAKQEEFGKAFKDSRPDLLADFAGPAALHFRVEGLMRAAEVTKNRLKKRRLYKKALVALRRFQAQARPLLHATPALAKAPIEEGGKTTTPARLLALSRAEAADVKMMLAGLRKARSKRWQRS
jgi:hypothetical protein